MIVKIQRRIIYDNSLFMDYEKNRSFLIRTSGGIFESFVQVDDNFFCVKFHVALVLVPNEELPVVGRLLCQNKTRESLSLIFKCKFWVAILDYLDFIITAINFYSRINKWWKQFPTQHLWKRYRRLIFVLIVLIR